MIVDLKKFHPHWPWILWCSVIAILAGGWFWLAGAGGGSSGPGLTLGIGAGLIILFEMALWPKKSFRRWRKAGPARTWMRAHIWLGLLTVPLLTLHSGFRVQGTLATWLTFLFAFVIVSGVAGLLLQQRLPKLMLETVGAETVYTELDELPGLLAAEAEEFVQAACGVPAAIGVQATATRAMAAGAEARSGGGRRVVGAVRKRPRFLQQRPTLEAIANAEPLHAAFAKQLKPYLLDGPAAGTGLQDRNRADDLFDGLRRKLEPEAHPTVDALEDYCIRRRQVDRQARIHWWLHSWLAIHLPLSAAMVILMLVHAYLGLRYMTP